MTEKKTQPVSKLVELSELEPVIREILSSGGSFRMTITGTSNLPTMAGGRDQVTLSQITGPLSRYDLPLYRRDSGQYTLHRIVSVQPDGTYTCCGDHQFRPEPGIRQDQLIGVVTRICRKGREFSVDSRGYRFWVRTWGALLPCRRLLLRAYHLPGRVKRIFSRKRNA